MTAAQSNITRLLAALALGVMPTLAQAQTAADSANAEALRAQWRLPVPEWNTQPYAQPRSLGAMSITSPSGFGAEWGDVFGGAGYQHHTRPFPGTTELGNNDGVATMGFGLGTRRTLALEVVYDSFSTFRSGFFNTGALSFKLSHAFGTLGVAAGGERVITVGNEGDGGVAYYGAATKMFFPREGEGFLSAVGVTVGAGTGRFMRVQDIRNGRSMINSFVSVGARVTSAVGLVADWSGQDLFLAASVVPLRCAPLVIMPGVADVLGTSDSRPRFILGVGMGLRPADIARSVRDCF